jgi:hypothetical protein
MSGLPQNPGASVPPQRWARRSLSGIDVSWLSVLDFGEPRRALGITRDGRWAWAPSDGTYVVHPVEGASAVGLLPLLEIPLQVVQGAVRRAAVAAELDPGEVVGSLPARQVLLEALRTRSDHWVDLAIEWFDEVRQSDDLLAAVQGAASDKRLGQRTRHDLTRWARTWSAAV